METKDLILRNWQDSDAKALYEMCLDETLRKSGIDFYNSITDSRNTIQCWKNDKGFKVIADKRNDNFIGFISLGGMNRYDGYMEIEYAVDARYRNNGYAMQAVQRMLDYGFKEMNLSAIAAWVRSHNKESIKVLEKCSFTYEGRLRKHARDKSDTLCYSVLREEWERLSRLCIDIRTMNYDDIPSICRADGDESQKNIDYLKRQLDNQEKGECTALLALYNGAVAGYVFLYYKCRWGGLAGHNIPGIVDLFVFEKYRRKKIATMLLDTAENIARQYCNKIYLDVCLNSDYGPAQRFYIKRGYIPDGKGVYYKEKICEADVAYRNDDELTLCLVKEL